MRVLKKILFYSVLLWILTWALRYAEYEGIRSNKSGLFDKFNRLFHGANSYNALFIGSSRAECHFDPRIFDSITGYNSYNIGISGSNNSFTYGIYKAYLASSKAPEVVIMNVDFHFAHESSDTIYEFPRFFPYLDNEILFKELQQRDKRFYCFKYIPAYTLAFMGDKYLNNAMRGFSGRPGLYDQQCYKGFQPINALNYKNIDLEDSSVYTGSILKENADYLDSIIALSKRNNSRLYLVVSPTYIKGTRRIRNYREVMQQFEALAGKSQVDLLDYNLDPISSDKNYFADFYHMKKEGADAFTLKFSQDFVARHVKKDSSAAGK